MFIKVRLGVGLKTVWEPLPWFIVILLRNSGGVDLSLTI